VQDAYPPVAFSLRRAESTDLSHFCGEFLIPAVSGDIVACVNRNSSELVAVDLSSGELVGTGFAVTDISHMFTDGKIVLVTADQGGTDSAFAFELLRGSNSAPTSQP
jgi:hypothetical protein